MVRLIETRSRGPKEENSLAFGQILPLVLLAAPIVTIIENFNDIGSLQTSPGSSLMPVCAYPSPIPMNPYTFEVLKPGCKAHAKALYPGPDQDEAQVSFCGATTLAALSYLKCGATFIGGHASGVVPILPLAFSMITLQPALQALWITCTLWISKAAPRKFVAGCIQSLILLSFISLCFLDLFNRELPPERELLLTSEYLIPPMLLGNGISLGILLAGYIVLSAWVNLDLHLGPYSGTGHIWRMSRRLLTGLALMALSIAGLPLDGLYILQDVNTPKSAASILGFQIFWLVLEYLFERLALPEVRKLAIRGGLIVCVVILLFLAEGNKLLRDHIYGISWYDILPGLSLTMCICGVWVVLWPAMNMLAGGIFLMFRRIL